MKRAWSLQEDRLLIRLRCEGVDRDMIAETMGRGRNAVSSRSHFLQRLGIIDTVAPMARYWRVSDDGMEKLEAWHARAMRGSRRMWGQSQRDQVAGLFQAGLGYRAIAVRLDAPPVSVRKVLTELRQEGEIGYEVRPWTDAEVTELTALHYGGADDARIALKLGRSAEAVIQKRRGLKLQRGTKGAPLWS